MWVYEVKPFKSVSVCNDLYILFVFFNGFIVSAKHHDLKSLALLLPSDRPLAQRTRLLGNTARTSEHFVSTWRIKFCKVNTTRTECMWCFGELPPACRNFLGLGLLICKSYFSYSSLQTDPMNISILGNEY